MSTDPVEQAAKEAAFALFVIGELRIIFPSDAPSQVAWVGRLMASMLVSNTAPIRDKQDRARRRHDATMHTNEYIEQTVNDMAEQLERLGL